MRGLKYIALVVLALSGSIAFPAHAGEMPRPGDKLPDIAFIAPELQKDRQYLGLNNGQTFTLSDLDVEIVMIEVIGVYCPQCHRQAPIFNRLFNRLSRDPALKDKVRMFCLTVGATSREIQYLREKFQTPFPILNDPEFKIHKILGEPDTPFTMLVDGQGNVLFAHLGVIEDIDLVYNKMQQLTR